MNLSNNNLPDMKIAGVGAVTPCGRDLLTIALQLDESARAKGVSRLVPDAMCADSPFAKRLRRADRFTRMAVTAANDAWTRSKKSCADVPMERIGLIVSSGFGPHGRGFKFLDGVLDCGDEAALPTDFSHSVHGAPAAYITELLGLRGPSLSTTAFNGDFEQAVQLANCWLADGTCDRVMVGAVEELGEVLLHCLPRMLTKRTPATPGEGAVFIVLQKWDQPPGMSLAVGDREEKADLIAFDKLRLGQPDVKKSSRTYKRRCNFARHFGHSPSLSAFQLLGCYLSIAIKHPIGEVPQHRERARAFQVDNAATFRPLSDPALAMLMLRNVKLVID